MELTEGLLTRRSVRKYADKKIEKETMEEIIRVAQYAPSAHDRRPWEFVVIEDKKALADFRSMQRYTSFAADASAVILVCIDEEKTFSREKEGWSYADIDGSAATMNVLLAAHGKGLGACWCGCSPMIGSINAVKEYFSLPENILPFSIVVLGYPEGDVHQPDTRFDQSKIHWEKW